MSSELVAHFLHTVPLDDVMAHLARVSAYDRYQASRGIEQAAALVAETAREIGLSGVSVESFPADGAARWWSFRAPVSWTPAVARLEVHAGGGRVLEIDHARQPFSVATYSAPTPRGGIVAPLVNVRDINQSPNVNGAVAVVARPDFAQADLLTKLAAAGALGFLTDAPCCVEPPGREHPGRIELDPDASLFGFSVTSSQLDLVRARADGGAQAHVVIDIDRSASMPVVTGVLPGEGSEDEVWLIAHLCHPRPGANDNASGVAALLGVAAALTASRRTNASRGAGRTIRFLWGPEFLGTAAFLHRRMGLRGKAGLPSAVIDFDMVGEDQSLCGSPFVVERSPDFRPTLINPLAEHVMGQAFAQTSGHHGTWRPTPFTGFSDHALFADPNVGCAAVQFCHAPDRFNHSAADTLDKVSRVEMLRATAAGAALSWIMANDKALPRPALERIVTDWCAAESADALRGAQTYGSLKGGEWARRLVSHVEERNAAVLSLLNRAGACVPGGSATLPADDSEEHAVKGHWSGPLNVRAMLADLPGESRSAVFDLIRADKFNYSLLLNFALRADGRRSQSDVIDDTSFAFRRPLDERVAKRLFGALIESGWVKEVPREIYAR
jgi:hypothetical protein